MHQLTARIVSNADANDANNKAEITTVSVEPVIPAPYDATSQAVAEGIEITWKAPNTRGAVNDDIESYQDWAIANIGDWTTIDLDHDTTYGNTYRTIIKVERIANTKIIKVLNSS